MEKLFDKRKLSRRVAATVPGAGIILVSNRRKEVLRASTKLPETYIVIEIKKKHVDIPWGQVISFGFEASLGIGVAIEAATVGGLALSLESGLVVGRWINQEAGWSADAWWDSHGWSTLAIGLKVAQLPGFVIGFRQNVINLRKYCRFAWLRITEGTNGEASRVAFEALEDSQGEGLIKRLNKEVPHLHVKQRLATRTINLKQYTQVRLAIVGAAELRILKGIWDAIDEFRHVRHDVREAYDIVVSAVRATDSRH